MSLGMILEQKLKELDMTKAEFARRISVSDTTVCRYINNGMIPRPAILNKMAEVLNCSVKELIRGCF